MRKHFKRRRKADPHVSGRIGRAILVNPNTDRDEISRGKLRACAIWIGGRESERVQSI